MNSHSRQANFLLSKNHDRSGRRVSRVLAWRDPCAVTHEEAHMRSGFSLTFSEADAIARAGAEPNESHPVSIAVVEDAGSLMAFIRMDGARSHSIV